MDAERRPARVLVGVCTLGHLKALNDAMGGITTSTYDARGNLETVADANQHAHTFTYDKVNRVKTEARPLGQAITYDYDEVGNLITRTSPKGERRTYGYDDAERRASENQYPTNAQTPSQTIAYSYDGRNLLISYTQSGDTHSSATYSYDSKGQKLGETVIYGAGNQTILKAIHYAYEPNGLKKSLLYPDGTAQTSTYDKNRLATVSIRGSTFQYQNYVWRTPTKVTMPGATRTLSYDPLQRPLEIRSQSIGDGTQDAPLGSMIMDYRYTYDLAGNITKRETEDGDYLYSYDNLDRLTGVAPPVSLQQRPGNPNGLPIEQYAYDAVHNRKTSAHQPGSWRYNANDELLSYGAGGDEQTYTYDNNGNASEQRTGDPGSPSNTRLYLYNAIERLSEVKDNGVTIARYQYDPMGRRIRKETPAGVTWFQYADEGLIAEYKEDGAIARTYGWGPGNSWATDPVWLADVSGTAWSINFYHNDVLGATQRLSALNGNITWKATAEAFGKTQVSVGQTLNPLRFPGQYEDSESKLFYNNQRDYSPYVGRYMTRDPFRAGGPLANAYIYANQNPLVTFDNYGLFNVDDSPPDDNSNTIYCNNGSSDVLLGDLYPGKKGACLNDGIVLHENIHKSRFDRSTARNGCGKFRGRTSIVYTNISECDNEERIALKDQREYYESKLRSEECTDECKKYLREEIQYISNILAQSTVPICRCFQFWFEGGKLQCLIMK